MFPTLPILAPRLEPCTTRVLPVYLFEDHLRWGVEYIVGQNFHCTESSYAAGFLSPKLTYRGEKGRRILKSWFWRQNKHFYFQDDSGQYWNTRDFWIDQFDDNTTGFALELRTNDTWIQLMELAREQGIAPVPPTFGTLLSHITVERESLVITNDVAYMSCKFYSPLRDPGMIEIMKLVMAGGPLRNPVDTNIL